MSTTTRTPALSRVLAGLRAGAYDSDLGLLAEVLSARIAASGTRFCWQLTFAGTTWTEQTVTSGERGFVEHMLSVGATEPFSYLTLDPVRYISHAVALLVAHLHKVDRLDLATAVAMAEGVTEEQWRDVVDVYQAEGTTHVNGDESGA